jgi:segregation and condensation protein A
MDTQVFNIKTEVFEGPLPLLLHLIQKRKLFINDISLASVADEYIDHVKRGVNLSIHSRASFIAVASTLLLIKSKSLLPSLELTVDEEEDIKKLELRLFFYKTIQEAAHSHVGPLFLKHPSYERVALKIKEVVFSPDGTISKESLHDNILDVLRTIPEPQKKNPEVYIEKVVSLEEMISSLTERIQKSMKMSFSQFSDSSHKETDQGKKVHVIVSFLALLELVRQGIVQADQGERHGDIEIEQGFTSEESYQD